MSKVSMRTKVLIATAIVGAAVLALGMIMWHSYGQAAVFPRQTANDDGLVPPKPVAVPGPVKDSVAAIDLIDPERVFRTTERDHRELLLELVEAIRSGDGAQQTILEEILLARGEAASSAAIELFRELLDTPLAASTEGSDRRVATLVFASLARIAMRMPHEEALEAALMPLRKAWNLGDLPSDTVAALRQSYDVPSLRPESARLSQRDLHACSLLLCLMCEVTRGVPSGLTDLLRSYSSGALPAEYPDPWISQVLAVKDAAALFEKELPLCSELAASAHFSASLRLQVRLMLQSRGNGLAHLVDLLTASPEAAKAVLAGHLRGHGLRGDELLSFARLLIETFGASEASSILQTALLEMGTPNLNQLRLAFPELFRACASPDATRELQFVLLTNMAMVTSKTYLSSEPGTRGALAAPIGEREFERLADVLIPFRGSGKGMTSSARIAAAAADPSTSLMLLAECGGPLASVLDRMLDVVEDPEFVPTHMALTIGLLALTESYSRTQLSEMRDRCGALVNALFRHPPEKVESLLTALTVGGQLTGRLVTFLEFSGRPTLSEVVLRNVALEYPSYVLHQARPQDLSKQTMRKMFRGSYLGIQVAIGRLTHLGYAVPEHPDWTAELDAAIERAERSIAEDPEARNTGDPVRKSGIGKTGTRVLPPDSAPDRGRD